MAEHVAGAVDAGALAVPHGEYAVVPALAAQLGLLRAPHRGGGKVLVDTALEADRARLQKLSGALKLGVEAAERRTAVAGDETRGIAAVAAVQLLLHQAEPDQGLEAGDENPRLGKIVFIVERDGTQLHCGRGLRGPVCP